LLIFHYMRKTKTKLVDKHTNQGIRIEKQSRFLGMCGWYRVDHPHCSASFIRGAKEVWIVDIWVPPGHRSRGLGTAVLKAIIAWSDQLPIALYPVPPQNSDMNRLIRWYRRFGFRPALGGAMRHEPNSQMNTKCAAWRFETEESMKRPKVLDELEAKFNKARYEELMAYERIKDANMAWEVANANATLMLRAFRIAEAKFLKESEK
jgi:GNAT superfamily N-acetyltransferase